MSPISSRKIVPEERLFKLANVGLVRISECSLLVTKELTLQEVLRNGSAVDNANARSLRLLLL